MVKVAMLVPCCQVVGCGVPIRNPGKAGYFLVRDSPHDPIGRQVVVCEDCRPLFERAPTPEREPADDDECCLWPGTNRCCKENPPPEREP